MQRVSGEIKIAVTKGGKAVEEPKTPEQVKSLLERYHDIPAMIAEEEAVIRHCKEQRQVIALSGVCVNGLPNGKGQVSDPTANMAQGQDREYEQEIKACKARISDLRLERIWVYEHMRRLSRIDERIMRLKYIGPADPARREKWRQPTFFEIGRKIGYSEARVKERAYKTLKNLAKT